MNIQVKTQDAKATKPLVDAQINGQAKAQGISREKVIHDVLLAQQPNKCFTTVEGIRAR